jgi:hypothetical protein
LQIFALFNAIKCTKKQENERLTPVHLDCGFAGRFNSAGHKNGIEDFQWCGFGRVSQVKELVEFSNKS